MQSESGLWPKVSSSAEGGRGQERAREGEKGLEREEGRRLTALFVIAVFFSIGGTKCSTSA